MDVRPDSRGLGSGGIVGADGAPVEELPLFPRKMPQLVLKEENTNLLAALLPTLNKYGCLESEEILRTKNRSPWSKAFCDLYHPSGPWGSNKFKNVPAITNKNVRNSFKKKILNLCNYEYEGDSAVHKDLYEKLREYKEKEKYYNDYMEFVRNEISKPTEMRAPIPTTTASVAVAAIATVNTNTDAVAAATASSSSQDQSDDDTRQATEDELLQVGDKVYAPYPGNDPISEYYYWGKVSKKYKDDGKDGGNGVWKYDIDFFDGDQVFGVTSQHLHRMKETLDLMRQGHLANDSPPKEYMEEDKEEEKNLPTAIAKKNSGAKSSNVSGLTVLPIENGASKEDRRKQEHTQKKRKSRRERKLPEIENGGNEKEQEQEIEETIRTPPRKRRRVIEAGGPDYIADSPSRINQKRTNITAAVTPVAASLPPPPPPLPESIQSNEAGSSTRMAVSSTGKDTKTTATENLKSTSTSREEKIEKSRSKLIQLLQRRRQFNADDDDPVCIKIKSKIDLLDTEMMDLILLDDDNDA